MLRVDEINRDNLSHVIWNLRDWDRREIFACRWDDDTQRFIEDFLKVPFMGWCFGLERPIVIAGALPIRPGVWSACMFATDEFPLVALGLTSFVRRCIIPALQSQGAHRAECASLDGHVQAHRWLEILGATKTSRLTGYGRSREDFWLFEWRW